jgi:uncharacterized membrane protein YedE/YeeE
LPFINQFYIEYWNNFAFLIDCSLSAACNRKSSMLAEFSLGGLTPRAASIVLGAVLGLAFGILAQRTGFCLRRGIVGPRAERREALGVWLFALAVAVAGTGLAVSTGLIDFSGHRLVAANLPVAAIVIGGLLFGAGMVLTRGCASRLTVLAGSGNLRALTALIVFAAVAHAALKGALAPVRTALGAFTVDFGAYASLAALPGGALFWSSSIAVVLAVLAFRSGARSTLLIGGGLIGALAPLGWLGTGYLLADEFDPLPLESIALTSAGAETLFWWVASSAIAPTFGVGFLAGVLSGSFIAAIATRDFAWTGFTEETRTGRYLAGGAMMGLGGVLAGGCTIGAGLAGIGTLGVSAILALAAIVAGAKLADAASRRQSWTKASAPFGTSGSSPSLTIASRAISL